MSVRLRCPALRGAYRRSHSEKIHSAGEKKADQNLCRRPATPDETRHFNRLETRRSRLRNAAFHGVPLRIGPARALAVVVDGLPALSETCSRCSSRLAPVLFHFRGLWVAVPVGLGCLAGMNPLIWRQASRAYGVHSGYGTAATATRIYVSGSAAHDVNDPSNHGVWSTALE